MKSNLYFIAFRKIVFKSLKWVYNLKITLTYNITINS